MFVRSTQFSKEQNFLLMFLKVNTLLLLSIANSWEQCQHFHKMHGLRDDESGKCSSTIVWEIIKVFFKNRICRVDISFSKYLLLLVQCILTRLFWTSQLYFVFCCTCNWSRHHTLWTVYLNEVLPNN